MPCRFRNLIFALLVSAVLGGAASACSVCMGNRDSPLVKGAEGGVLLLVIVTYVMLMGFVGIGVTWFVRARRLSRPKPTDPNEQGS